MIMIMQTLFTEPEIAFKICPEKCPTKMKFDRKLSNLVTYFFNSILISWLHWVNV
jgi:hypothetical protein